MEQSDTTDSNSSNIHNDTKQTDTITKSDTLIPLPKFCHTKKWQTCRKVSKYVYVIGVIILGFGIAILEAISPQFEEWFEKQQEAALTFVDNNHVMYTVLILALITFLKSIGVKDILGLRTISVCILSYRICKDPPFLTLVVCMFIIGILSSLSKLIEYQVIGHELQVVQGTPVEYIFKYARLLLSKCLSEHHLVWLDPKYTFAISELSRNDKSMDIITNFKEVGQELIVSGKCCCRVQEQSDDKQGDDEEKTDENMTDKVKSCMCDALYYLAAIIWTSVVEWIQPITELFLYAHNWTLSISNVVIIVFSEWADIDKAVEAAFLINALRDPEQSIIEAKVDAFVSKFFFWAIGYTVVMPISLIWAYLYAKKNGIAIEDDNEECEKDKDKEKNENGLNDIQMEEKNNENTEETTTSSMNV